MLSYLTPAIFLAATTAVVALPSSGQRPPWSGQGPPGFGGGGPPSVSCGSQPSNTSDPQTIMTYLQCNYHQNTQKLLESNSGTCSFQDLSIRMSYSNLTSSQRTSYINAVKCLHKLPPQTNRALAPGVRSRVDDFIFAHINQTNYMHSDGSFLPWHRQFIWSYEQSLRNECNYTGPLPYWDFAEFSDNQLESPIFDGSATSLGGNGKYVEGEVITQDIPGLARPFPVTRYPGTGGGCIEQTGGLGPYTVDLGPVVPANNTPDNTYGLDYNPRCLSRSFNQTWSQTFLNLGNIVSALQAPNIVAFNPQLDRTIHGPAHWTIGGDAFDLFSSPNDPAFFLLHTQIDRLWTLWQGQDYASRGEALSGTTTFVNDPPSANATLETELIYHSASANMPIGDVMSAIGGHYCYVYA